jgi:hypothetical protein
MKSWKSRFFVLENGTLSYYEKEILEYPYGVNKKGGVNLKNMKIEEKDCIVRLYSDGQGDRDLIMVNVIVIVVIIIDILFYY